MIITLYINAYVGKVKCFVALNLLGVKEIVSGTDVSSSVYIVIII